MSLSEDDVRWMVAAPTYLELQEGVIAQVGERAYHEELVPDLRRLVLAYIDVHDRCDGTIGKTFRPLGATKTGGKLFKVRLGVPGQGKSGGLRVLLALHCEDRECRVLLARWRRDASNRDEELAADRDW